MDPHPGLHVASDGKGRVDVGTCWVISQVTPSPCKSLVNVALNGCCSFVGTEAVGGVTLTAIPESSVSWALPVFLVSAAAVAVMVIIKRQDWLLEVQLLPAILVGSGTLLGAVNTTVVFVEFAGMVPVSAMHSFELPVVDLPAESVEVV